MPQFLSYNAYTEQNRPSDFIPTLTGAGVCIVVNEEVLLLQRGENHRLQPSTWGIPAGKLEDDELPQQAAQRETLEEAGIDISLERMKYRGDLYFDVKHTSPLNIHFHVFTVFLPQRPSVILEPAQVAFCWVSLDVALQLPLFTGTREVLLLGMSRY